MEGEGGIGSEREGREQEGVGGEWEEEGGRRRKRKRGRVVTLECSSINTRG